MEKDDVWIGWDILSIVLGVPEEWLKFGDNPPDWYDDSQFKVLYERARASTLAQTRQEPLFPPLVSGLTLHQVGVVVAGDGNIDDFIETVQDFPIPAHWSVVQVEGDSAYPVIYRRQFALIDPSRAVRPTEMTDADRRDLHNNTVLIQVDAGEGKKHRALLKRFCWAKGAPGDFVLASLDGGRDSPFVPPEAILLIVPAVGSIWVDPRVPRVKRSVGREPTLVP